MTGRYKQLVIHMEEAVQQRARERTRQPAFFRQQQQRRKIEALFAELKNQIGLRRVRLRRMKHVREQFLVAAAAQNLKRLVRHLTIPNPSEEPSSGFRFGRCQSPQSRRVIFPIDLRTRDKFFNSYLRGPKFVGVHGL